MTATAPLVKYRPVYLAGRYGRIHAARVDPDIEPFATACGILSNPVIGAGTVHIVFIPTEDKQTVTCKKCVAWIDRYGVSPESES